MSSPKSSSVMIGGFSKGHLLKLAEELINEKTKKTIVLDEDAVERMPKFDMNELAIGKVLGKGAFCVVSEIKAMHLGDGQAAHMSEPTHVDDCPHLVNIVQDRNFMQSNYLRNGKDARYAIKILKKEVTRDVQMFVNGIVDMAMEAKFLAVIRHPNIIKMRAVACGTSCSPDYFLLLDRLYDILPAKIQSWKKRQVKCKGIGKLLDRKGKKQKDLWLERLHVAYDLSSALRYMHGLDIVYRDLKPENIGFDVRGDAKIFDLGLAKELHADSRCKDGTYKLTGYTGSHPYMAPEVALQEPYNERADVYSFGILLWQILELSTPFEGFTLALIEKKVVSGGARPKIDLKWPVEIASLISACWHSQLAKRPNMLEVCSALTEEFHSNGDDYMNESADASRKSELSSHKPTAR